MAWRVRLGAGDVRPLAPEVVSLYPGVRALNLWVRGAGANATVAAWRANVPESGVVAALADVILHVVRPRRRPASPWPYRRRRWRERRAIPPGGAGLPPPPGPSLLGLWMQHGGVRLWQVRDAFLLAATAMHRNQLWLETPSMWEDLGLLIRRFVARRQPPPPPPARVTGVVAAAALTALQAYICRWFRAARHAPLLALRRCGLAPDLVRIVLSYW